MNALTACLLCFLVNVNEAQDVDVQTNSGTVRGVTKETNTINVQTFLGVPYAEPPIGRLRFRRPVPVSAWDGVKYTNSLPNSCHQSLDTMFDRHKGVEMWNANTEMSEDCLYLNVWTRNTQTTKKKPVLVWIFGGGFWSGTSTLDVYNGKYLAALNDVVVVSMNYRVGPLGFMYLDIEDSPGNMGLLDQQLALQWIYDNVDKFGGDRERITIFGESAGAVSVAYHMLSPLSQSLFTRASMLSGSAYSYWGIQQKDVALSRANTFAEKAGCNGQLADAKATVTCLRELDAQKLTSFQWDITEYYFDPPFAAVIDGYFLTDSPENLMKNNKMKKCDILTGAVSDEGNFWLLYGILKQFPFSGSPPMSREDFLSTIDTVTKPYLNDADHLVKDAIVFQYDTSVVKSAHNMSYRDIIDDMSGDLLFTCSVFNFAHEYVLKGQNVYTYNFDQRTQNNPWPEWMGVLHGYEVEFIFGWPQNDSLGYTTQERELSTQMMNYWSNFAATGNPNLSPNLSASTIMWPPYSVDKREYKILRKPEINGNTGNGYRHRQCSFWKTMVPKLENRQGVCVSGSHGLSFHWISPVAAILLVTLSSLGS